jgi:GNAT superfamily N-acetyltransferase
VLAWDGDDLVAHGVWVRVGPSRAAELALVVTDSHQRRGIGAELAERLVAAAGARGIERIEAFSESGNRAVARMVARGAPDADRDRDGVTVSYSFAIDGRPRMAEAPWRPTAA